MATLCTHISHGQSHRIGIDKIFSRGEKDFVNRNIALEQYCREPAYCILSAALSTASFFRIWNSSTGILSLPGASVRNSAHDKGHEEGGSAYAKAGSSLRSPPGNSRASTPKPESAYFLLCAFTYTSDFTGGCLPLPLSGKRVSLQLQLSRQEWSNIPFQWLPGSLQSYFMRKMAFPSPDSKNLSDLWWIGPFLLCKVKL